MQKSISFEFFPPKSPEGLTALEQHAKRLEVLSPEFFSVTYGAGGSTRQGTIDTVKMLQTKTGVNITPHLSCIGSTREELLDILAQYKMMGVKRLVVLRGDLPSGMGQSGEFQHAVDLVHLIRDMTGDYFYIDVAAYPECHPQAKNALEDVMHLKRKLEAGANSAITQYFFSLDAYFYFIDECAKEGIFAPITPGIMPITHFSKIVRFSGVCGAEIPRWLYKRLECFGDDTDSIQAFALEVVGNLCERLLAGGAPGLHFYTLNQADASFALVKKLQINQPAPMVSSLKSLS